ncbi:hypothetical protein, partial [Burkholderia stagnalis]|uniref:hypothetical protein n=1 Tax=Burkholderia stagnalis TaxID=1503054 RepID=UPI001C894F48
VEPGWIPIISTRDSLPDWLQNSAAGQINKSAISHRVLLPDVSVKDTLHFVAPWVSSMNTDLVFATIALANFRKS